MNDIESELRKDCPMRHENGNCLPCGGFCTAVNDSICEGLHSAYDAGWYDALRAQLEVEQGCDKCSGIMYRQTDSGKVIPIEQKCGVKIVPPCYQPDGDGCAYQIYGDNNDEPIERCKECPLCYSDKVRHQEAEKNEPVKHGWWLKIDDTKCECSICEVITLIAQYPNGDKNFCPNCGAKMDAEEE